MTNIALPEKWATNKDEYIGNLYYRKLEKNAKEILRMGIFWLSEIRCLTGVAEMLIRVYTGSLGEKQYW